MEEEETDEEDVVWQWIIKFSLDLVKYLLASSGRYQSSIVD